MRYKISLIGSFGFGKVLRDGQTIKTIEYAKLLERVYAAEQINRVDTRGWTKNPLGLFLNVLRACRNSECVIMLPASHAVRVIPALAVLCRSRNVKLFHSVIGGTLPGFLASRPILTRVLKRLDGIWVETERMKRKLNELGLFNVSVVANFKDLKPLQEEELPYAGSAPFKLCVFSRIMKQKGITFAVEALAGINARHDRPVYLLDIYGPVSEDYREEFCAICEKYGSFVSYKGAVDSDKSTPVIMDSFALLFPTLYRIEGVPGTVVDAYCAGVPVIASRWQNFADVVDEGVTGYGFELGSKTDLMDLLSEIARNPEMILSLKKNCLKKARNYMPDAAVKRITSLING